MSDAATRTVDDLDQEIDSLLAKGYRLDMIMPADAPCRALLSRGTEEIQLSQDPQAQIRNPKPMGRAGMEYRDLIPGRLDGRVIASHIRLTKGGEVPDYVHYHKLYFQMIYCIAGWVRVVYESQGDPFVMRAGDCILQPPEIRHRVLESSAGAEVIEVSSPAEHETWVEHEMVLPTSHRDRSRSFSGQRFARYTADSAKWIRNQSSGNFQSDTGISAATGGIADVRIVKLLPGSSIELGQGNDIFAYFLTGTRANTSFVARAGEMGEVEAAEDTDILCVRLPA